MITKRLEKERDKRHTRQEEKIFVSIEVILIKIGRQIERRNTNK